MDKLSRPFLVLHGTNNRNVSFVDSLRLFAVLREIHFCRRNFVLRDAYRRAEEFCERELKNGLLMTSR